MDLERICGIIHNVQKKAAIQKHPKKVGLPLAVLVETGEGKGKERMCA